MDRLRWPLMMFVILFAGNSVAAPRSNLDPKILTQYLVTPALSAEDIQKSLVHSLACAPLVNQLLMMFDSSEGKNQERAHDLEEKFKARIPDLLKILSSLNDLDPESARAESTNQNRDHTIKLDLSSSVMSIGAGQLYPELSVAFKYGLMNRLVDRTRQWQEKQTFHAFLLDAQESLSTLVHRTGTNNQEASLDISRQEFADVLMIEVILKAVTGLSLSIEIKTQSEGPAAEMRT